MDIRKKLEENNGVYWVNMADPEEAEFVLERMGGKKLLEEKFPLMYQAYCKTVEHARQNDIEELADKVSITPHTSYTNGKAGTTFNGSISGFTCDPAITAKDLGLASPRPWRNVSVNLTIADKDDPSRPPFTSVTTCHRNTNTFYDEISTPSEVPESIVAKTNLCLFTEFQGLDPDGRLHTNYSYEDFSNHVNHGIKIVDYIILDDPKYKNSSNNNPVIMLYGRDATQNPDFQNADYIGGEYKENNGGAEGDKRLKTLMPLKGTITFKRGYEFVKLAAPKPQIPMYRPVISLNSSQIVRYFQDEWNGDNPDQKMYDAIKDGFQADKTEKNICHFDLKINGSVDWKADLKDAGRYIKDNTRVLDYQVSAAFRLDVSDGEMIHPVTLIVQYTSSPDVPLYTSFSGDSTVYIPAVRVYWGCMAKDSSIRTPHGKKLISEIKPGDKIITADGHCVTTAQVLYSKEEKIYRIKTDKGSIGLTGGHPILLKGKKEKRAADLQAGDFLLMWNQQIAKISEVCLEDYNDDVYNLLVQGSKDGTFLFANGFAVGDAASQNRPLKAALPEYTDEELKLQDEFEQLLAYRKANS